MPQKTGINVKAERKTKFDFHVGRVFNESCCQGQRTAFRAKVPKAYANMLPPDMTAVMFSCKVNGTKMIQESHYPLDRYDVRETVCPPNAMNRQKCYKMYDTLQHKYSSKTDAFGPLVKHGGNNPNLYQHTKYLKNDGNLVCPN